MVSDLFVVMWPIYGGIGIWSFVVWLQSQCAIQKKFLHISPNNMPLRAKQERPLPWPLKGSANHTHTKKHVTQSMSSWSLCSVLVHCDQKPVQAPGSTSGRFLSWFPNRASTFQWPELCRLPLAKGQFSWGFKWWKCLREKINPSSPSC